MDYVVGQNPVTRHPLGQPFRERLKVGEQAQSHEQQHVHQDEIDQGVQDGRLGHAASVPNRQEALHRDLVGAVVLHQLKQVGESRTQSRHLEPVQLPLPDVQAARLAGHGHDLRHPARHAVHQSQGHPQSAARQQGKLEHVGPDYRRQSPCRGIGRGDNPHQENGGIEADAGHYREGQGRRVDDHSQPAHAGQAEQSGHAQARRPAVAQIHVLVSGDDLQLAVEGIEDQDQQRGHQRAHQAEHHHRDVFAKGDAGDTQEGRRTGEGGEHADSDREPGHAASAQEEILGAPLLSRQSQADPDQGRQVDHQHQQVQPAEFDCLHCSPLPTDTRISISDGKPHPVRIEAEHPDLPAHFLEKNSKHTMPQFTHSVAAVAA